MDRKLDITLCTWQPNGMKKIAAMNLPRIEGVTYVVSWQQAGENPEIPASIMNRTDVEIFHTESRGMSPNRNNACDHCKAPLIIIGDDDLTYYPERIREAIDLFDSHPELDMALLRHDGDGKYYPDKACRLGTPLPRGLYSCSIDIMFRRKVFETVRFNEKFGLNAPIWQAAEDEVFLHDLRKKGFNCWYYPITLCCHDHPSTGDKILTPGVAAAAGKFIRMEYPRDWILRIPLKAWRERRRGGNPVTSIYHMFRGAMSNGDR